MKANVSRVCVAKQRTGGVWISRLARYHDAMLWVQTQLTLASIPGFLEPAGGRWFRPGTATFLQP